MVKDVTEERLLETVKTAKLESLMKRIGGFDTQQDWSATVSTSELQLLALLNYWWRLPHLRI